MRQQSSSPLPSMSTTNTSITTPTKQVQVEVIAAKHSNIIVEVLVRSDKQNNFLGVTAHSELYQNIPSSLACYSGGEIKDEEQEEYGE